MTFFWLLLGFSTGSLVGPLLILMLDEELILPSGWWILPGLAASICFWLAALT